MKIDLDKTMANSAMDNIKNAVIEYLDTAAGPLPPDKPYNSVNLVSHWGPHLERLIKELTPAIVRLVKERTGSKGAP